MYGIVDARMYVENYNPATEAATWTADRDQAQRFTLAEAERYADHLGCAFRIDSHQEQTS